MKREVVPYLARARTLALELNPRRNTGRSPKPSPSPNPKQVKREVVPPPYLTIVGGNSGEVRSGPKP